MNRVASKTSLRNLFLVLLIATFSLISVESFFGERLRGLSIDILSALVAISNLSTKANVNSQVVVIGIDEETYKIDPFRGTPRVMWTPQIAEVVQALIESEAALIGFDVIFPTSVRKFIPDYERDFLKTLQETASKGKLVLGKVQHRDQPIAPEPAQSFAVGHSRNVRALNFQEDTDAIIRRVPTVFDSIYIDEKPVEVTSFSGEIAQRLILMDSVFSENHDGLVVPKKPTLLNFDLRKGAIPTFSFADIYECINTGRQDFLKKHFMGKAVLLGTVLDVEDRKLTSMRYAARSIGDPKKIRCLSTPENIINVEIQKARESISGVFVHATAINNLVFRNALRVVDHRSEILFNLALLVLVSLSVLKLPVKLLIPTWGLSSTILIGLGVIALSFGFVVSVLTTILASAVVLLLSLSFRYFVLDVKRRQLSNVFSLYLPKHEVERLSHQESPPVLGGEKKTITILISDIKDFTSISEQLDPVALVSILNRYLTLMTNVIEERGGVVDKYVGDSVIAFFGAPVSHEDDQTRAIDAARACMEIVSGDAELKRLLPHAILKTRVGINSGSVIVGNVGSNRRMNYTVVGDEVNLAARLESANKVFDTDILIAESVVLNASCSNNIRKVAILRVKGRHKPVSVYTLESRLNAQEIADFEFSLNNLSVDPEGAERVFETLAERDPVSSLYVDLINGKCVSIASLNGEVIDLVEK